MLIPPFLILPHSTNFYHFLPIFLLLFPPFATFHHHLLPCINFTNFYITFTILYYLATFTTFTIFLPTFVPYLPNFTNLLSTVCFHHVTYAFQNESTLYSCLNVKELLVGSRHKIWSLSDCNWTRTQNHLVYLTKWLTDHLRAKRFGVWVQL